MSTPREHIQADLLARLNDTDENAVSMKLDDQAGIVGFKKTMQLESADFESGIIEKLKIMVPLSSFSQPLPGQQVNVDDIRYIVGSSVLLVDVVVEMILMRFMS